VLKAFYTDGPEIQFWGSRTVDAVRPSYWQLMTGTDMTGQARSFLSTDDGFRFVKAMQMRNLIIPVVGDFGGPAAIRRIGEYARAHRVEVHAFYGSNVGVYLNTEQARAFCRSLATLPVANGAWYIERDGSRPLSAKLRSCAPATK
jgi:L-alanine-DL-glutamate epimerase-like enolase superfamily enzyme